MNRRDAMKTMLVGVGLAATKWVPREEVQDDVVEVVTVPARSRGKTTHIETVRAEEFVGINYGSVARSTPFDEFYTDMVSKLCRTHGIPFEHMCEHKFVGRDGGCFDE